MRVTKVYTRGGDQGETALVSGARVSKASARVEAYGDIDEANSLIGVVRAENLDPEIDGVLQSIQNELFTLGADLASPADIAVPRIEYEWVKRLEQVLDTFNKELAPLQEFILPGGSKTAALLHLARTIIRRAERRIVHLSQEEKINTAVLAYVNRLSDLLFVLARAANQRSGTKESSADFSHRGKGQ